MKIGIKIWSTNIESFDKILDLFNKQIIDYLEIYIVPNSFDKKQFHKLLKIPIIFHAPAFHHEFSLTNKNQVYKNSIITIKNFMEFFQEKRIIFHPGYIKDINRDNINTLINNINELKKDFDIILENVPKNAVSKDLCLLVPDPNEFKDVIIKTNIKNCLDFGHAIISAKNFNNEPFVFINKFLELNPYMYHICDGDLKSDFDVHKSFGEGNYPIQKILELVPNNAFITLETPKSDYIELSEDINNLKLLKQNLKF